MLFHVRHQHVLAGFQGRFAEIAHGLPLFVVGGQFAGWVTKVRPKVDVHAGSQVDGNGWIVGAVRDVFKGDPSFAFPTGHDVMSHVVSVAEKPNVVL